MKRRKSPPEDGPGRQPNGWDVVVLSASAVILLLLRLHAFPAPLESDECNYAYFAQRLLAGDRLYVDLWDHQPPGIFAFLVIPTALFGASPLVYRVLALGACLLTLGLLYDLARVTFGRLAGWAAAVLFAVVSSDPGTAGEGCNREIYMNALLVAALWVLARGRVACPSPPQAGEGMPESGTPHRVLSLKTLLLAGVLVGLASTFKTVVAAQWGALALAIAALHIAKIPSRRSGSQLPPAVTSLLALAAGPALIWLGIWLYFTATARSAEFIDAVFTYNLAYSGLTDGPALDWPAFFGKKKVFSTALGLWLAGGLGLIALPWKRRPSLAVLLAMFALGAFVAVCLPGQFWPHYYYLMVPALVLLAAGLVDRIQRFRPGLGWIASVAIVMAVLSTEIPDYLQVKPDHIAWDRYKDRMAWVRDQAGRIASVTDPADTIYTWSADTGFYYYSGRRCASRYTMFGALIAHDPSAASRRATLIVDLNRTKPRLILIPAVREPPCPELLAFIQAQKYVSAGRDSRGMEILCPLDRPIPVIDWSYATTEKR